MKHYILGVILFVAPFFASADYVVKPFTLPSGIVYWAVEQVIGPIVVEAKELTQEEQYKIFAKTMAQFYGFPEDKFNAIIKCESNWNPEAKGDYKNGVPQSIGILQWQKRSFAHYTEKYNFTGDRFDPFSQIKLGAIVMGDIGSETDWFNCSQFYNYGTWDKTKWK